MAREVKVTAVELAEKWNRRIKGAGEDIRRGVDKVTENPAVKAVAAKAKMLSRLTEAVTSGKWERGLNRVTLADWKAAMTELGIGRIPAGADRAIPKVREFAGELIAHENAGLNVIDAMPDVTLEDSIQRMTSWIRHMSEFTR